MNSFVPNARHLSQTRFNNVSKILKGAAKKPTLARLARPSLLRRLTA